MIVRVQGRGGGYPEGVTQEVHVVVSQGSDAADDGVRDDVSRVQSPPQAHLQDNHIHPLLYENLEPCDTSWEARVQHLLMI
jgi:hypothetical protein